MMSDGAAPVGAELERGVSVEDLREGEPLLGHAQGEAVDAGALRRSILCNQRVPRRRRMSEPTSATDGAHRSSTI
jgi:hypothetical protein